MLGETKQIVVVLGCKVAEGAPSRALGRRLEQARDISGQYPELPVLFSGGRSWAGTSESQAMWAWWQINGTGATTLREDRSLTTLQNARETAELCRRHGISTVHLVTCDFHMARAASLFRRAGLVVIRHPAKTPARPVWARSATWAREWGARCLTPLEMLRR